MNDLGSTFAGNAFPMNYGDVCHENIRTDWRSGCQENAAWAIRLAKIKSRGDLSRDMVFETFVKYGYTYKVSQKHLTIIKCIYKYWLGQMLNKI